MLVIFNKQYTIKELQETFKCLDCGSTLLEPDEFVEGMAHYLWCPNCEFNKSRIRLVSRQQSIIRHNMLPPDEYPSYIEKGKFMIDTLYTHPVYFRREPERVDVLPHGDGSIELYHGLTGKEILMQLPLAFDLHDAYEKAISILLLK